MTNRLEVYLDTYSAKPIVQSTNHKLSINIGDEISRDDWLELLSEPASELELRVKVEDIKHLFWDNDACEHALSIKVVPI